MSFSCLHFGDNRRFWRINFEANNQHRYSSFIDNSQWLRFICMLLPKHLKKLQFSSKQFYERPCCHSAIALGRWWCDWFRKIQDPAAETGSTVCTWISIVMWRIRPNGEYLSSYTSGGHFSKNVLSGNREVLYESRDIKTNGNAILDYSASGMRLLQRHLCTNVVFKSCWVVR